VFTRGPSGLNVTLPGFGCIFLSGFKSVHTIEDANGAIISSYQGN
jgi:hypothetical protein